jgi:hypothetical protein
VAFLDDHSRFIVSYGLHASQSSALVLEVLRAGVASHGRPEVILTDFTDPYYKRDYSKRGPKAQDCEAVYYLSADHNTLTHVVDDLQQPSGIIGTPDGKNPICGRHQGKQDFCL